MPASPCQLRLGSSFEEVTSILGLDPTNPDDVRIYHIMLVMGSILLPYPRYSGNTNANPQHEVDQGRQRLVQNRDTLLPQFKQNTMIQPPYHRTQIDFKAFLQETKVIHLSACPETRARYDLVGKASGPESSNAAISWLLWQALRRGEQNG
jgi:hypothetical protein